VNIWDREVRQLNLRSSRYQGMRRGGFPRSIADEIAASTANGMSNRAAGRRWIETWRSAPLAVVAPSRWRRQNTANVCGVKCELLQNRGCQAVVAPPSKL